MLAQQEAMRHPASSETGLEVPVLHLNKQTSACPMVSTHQVPLDARELRNLEAWSVERIRPISVSPFGTVCSRERKPPYVHIDSARH